MANEVVLKLDGQPDADLATFYRQMYAAIKMTDVKFTVIMYDEKWQPIFDMLETEYKFVYESQKYEYLSNFRGEHQTIDMYESSTNEDMFRHFKYCPDLRRLEYKSRHSF